jgi:hypothetical protein
MDYYIQGNKEKAAEIKAAFEAKGCTLYRRASNCDSENLIYYSLNGIVRGIKKDNLYLFEAHPGYKELELPVEPKFKKGDWITNGTFTHYIVSIVDGFYYFYGGGYLDFGKIDGYYHLWTIEDAKDGDVLVDVYGNISIYEKCDDFDWMSYCSLGHNGGFQHFKIEHENEKTYPATKEQRDLLFAKMREAGYQWDADKKELRKVKEHYDISNFHAGMPVLVRDYNDEEWCYAQFSHMREPTYALVFNAGCHDWYQCIPFEGNEHLLGTTDMCDEQYVNW